MKKLFLIFAISCSCGLLAQDNPGRWAYMRQWIDDEGTVNVYFDKETVKATPDHSTVWIRNVDIRDGAYMLYKITFYCSTGKWNTTSATMYFASGKVESVPYPDGHVPIDVVPETLAEYLFNTFCVK